jgi:hypothetical protein
VHVTAADLYAYLSMNDHCSLALPNLFNLHVDVDHVISRCNYK